MYLRIKTRVTYMSQVTQAESCFDSLQKVVVLPKSGVMAGNLYRMNFYTEKSIRCVHQPQITIWIKIEESKGRADEGDYEPGIDVDTPE